MDKGQISMYAIYIRLKVYIYNSQTFGSFQSSVVRYFSNQHLISKMGAIQIMQLFTDKAIVNRDELASVTLAYTAVSLLFSGWCITDGGKAPIGMILGFQKSTILC